MRACRGILAALFAACSSPVASPEAALGEYPLMMVNGEPLPVSVTAPNGCEAVFGGGKLALSTTMDFSLRLSYGYQCSDGQTGHSDISAVGPYQRSRNVFYLRPDPGETISATLDGDFMTIRLSGTTGWGNSAFLLGPRRPLTSN